MALGYQSSGLDFANLRPCYKKGLEYIERMQVSSGAIGYSSPSLLHEQNLTTLAAVGATCFQIWKSSAAKVPRKAVRFIDKEFRAKVVARVTDEQVLAFWREEYPNMNYQNAVDGVAPIANKLGAFLAHPVVRKAVCEPEEPLRFRRLMDDGAGIIVNLAFTFAAP